MAYSSSLLKTLKFPVTFVAKMPRKDFVVLVVVIGIVAALIAGAVINKNKVEIAESFSNLAESAMKACNAYPEITGGSVYAKESCGCLECTEGAVAPIASAVPAVPAVPVVENFGRMISKKIVESRRDSRDNKTTR